MAVKGGYREDYLIAYSGENCHLTLPPNTEITLRLIPSSNSLVDSNTKVAGLIRNGWQVWAGMYTHFTFYEKKRIFSDDQGRKME